MPFDENQNNQNIINIDNIIASNTQFNNITNKLSITQSVQDESSHSGQTMFKVVIIRTALFFLESFVYFIQPSAGKNAITSFTVNVNPRSRIPLKQIPHL